MADAGVARDPGRLPWLEPYRGPAARKPSNRRPGVTASIGAFGLAVVIALLARDLLPDAGEQAAAPEASILLPAPEEMQPQIVLPPLEAPVPAEQAEAPVSEAATPVKTARPPRRKIKVVPTEAAYREVVKTQSEAPAMPEVTEAALAIAAIPLPPDPPRPSVDPSAKVVRGKTVQMGVYLTVAQAEAAWQHAIRDYTFLVTMPKNIEPISIRSKRFYRLQLGTPSKKHAKQLCTHLKSTGRACTVA